MRYRAIRLITAIGFITPSHSPACEGMSSTSRLNIFHVGEVRGRGSEQKGGIARRKGEQAIVVRIAVHIQVQAPLKPIGGGRSTPVRGASTVLRLVSVPRDVTAPLALRITSSTRSFGFSQLTGIRRTEQVSPWNSEDCRIWRRIVQLLLISLLHPSVFRFRSSERWVVSIFNLSDIFFKCYH